MITLVLDGLKLRSNNEYLRMNPMARHSYNKKIRRIVEIESLAQGLSCLSPTPGRKKVTITIQHKKSYDRDGRYGASKPILDAIVARPAVAQVGKVKIKIPGPDGKQVLRWGLIADDSERYIDLEVKEVIAETYKVTIEVDNA